MFTALMPLNRQPAAALSLFYSALVTPLFEELLFRGALWREAECDARRFAPLGNAALFGLWHLGYAETVLWRASVFRPGADAANILLWKALTGFALGLAFCFLRKKAKCALAPLLLHILINTVGS